MKKLIAVALLIAIVFVAVSSCGAISTGIAMKLVEEGRYEDAYKLLSVFKNDEKAKEALSHFYWVPVQVTVGDQVYTHVLNENNLPEIIKLGEEVVEEYYYTEDGRIAKNVIQEFMDSKTTIEYTYDSNGNILKFFYSSDDGLSAISTYTYNENGTVKEIDNYYSIGPSYKTEMVYNEKGQLVKEINTYESGGQTFVEYRYDEKGRVIFESNPWYDGTTESLTITYDEKGNILSKKSVFSDGMHWRYEYTYDNNGRMIREDYKGGYTADNDDFSSYSEYEYDENGNVVKNKDCNTDGEITVAEISYRLIYIENDAEGEVIWTIGGYRPIL